MEQNLIFGKKNFFSQQFLKMCLNDSKKDDFQTFSDLHSEHPGNAPALGRWCKLSFRVVQTFFRIVLFGVIRAHFMKMCLNDPKKDDCVTFSKDVNDELDIAPELKTCYRRSFGVIGALWSTFVFGLEMHILHFGKKSTQEKRRR